mgnify:CR=1 FL=1
MNVLNVKTGIKKVSTHECGCFLIGKISTKENSKMRYFMEKELRELLKNLPRHYDDFETAMVLLVGNNKKAMELLIKYLKDNPLATVSEVGQYTYSIGDE